MSKLAENQVSDKEKAVSGKLSEQYLTFLLGEDEYGIDILAVQEIHGWIKPRPIPDTPDYICGVFDWRGLVVPVVDLRIRFDYQEAVYDTKTVYIILKIGNSLSDQSFIAAIVVDAVSDVCNIEENEIKPSSEFGCKVNVKFIEGIAKVNDSIVVVLSLESLLNLSES